MTIHEILARNTGDLPILLKKAKSKANQNKLKQGKSVKSFIVPWVKNLIAELDHKYISQRKVSKHKDLKKSESQPIQLD